MRRMRTPLSLAAVACFVLSIPARAQVAPTLSGETGLFEITNADTIGAGHFSFGLSWSMWNRAAAPVPGSFPLPDDPLRYDLQRIGGSVGYGLLDRWELVVGTGANRYHAMDAAWQGVINGHYRAGGFTHSEQDKIRFASKVVAGDRNGLPVAFFIGYSIPTQSKNDVNALGTYRADWDFGVSFNYGWVTFQSKYLLTGKIGTPTDFVGGGNSGYENSNEWTNAFGIAVPIVPNVFKIISEINRVHFDGGDTQPNDFSEVLLGGRFAFGDFSASAAVRANIDNWVKYGSSPTNIGGLVQFAYLPSPRKPAPAKVAVAQQEPPPPPATEPVPPPPPAPAPATTPAPAPAEPAVIAAPAARPATTTTDEILFDAAKSRLTNIAKAILDGVALRLKNNLAATCTVSAWTDPKEKGDHAALAKARAEAAKDYLMKRHGIDGSRIATEVKGEGDSPDATRNRRAVVTVTFP